jgi:hypothetical protein
MPTMCNRRELNYSTCTSTQRPALLRQAHVPDRTKCTASHNYNTTATDPGITSHFPNTLQSNAARTETHLRSHPPVSTLLIVGCTARKRHCQQPTMMQGFEYTGISHRSVSSHSERMRGASPSQAWQSDHCAPGQALTQPNMLQVTKSYATRKRQIIEPNPAPSNDLRLSPAH